MDKSLDEVSLRPVQLYRLGLTTEFLTDHLLQA